jgi:hypothetical protein
MRKQVLAITAAVTLVPAGYFCSTEVGLRVRGTHAVVVDVPQTVDYNAVSRYFYAPDGTRLLVTAVNRQPGGPRIHAEVEGTHRYTLALFPTRWIHTFSMDRPAVEHALRQAAGANPASVPTPAGRRWHPLAG